MKAVTILAPDGFPLPDGDPQTEAHHFLSGFLEQTKHLSSTYKFVARDYSYGSRILAQGPRDNIAMAHAAFKRFEWLLRDYDDLPRTQYDYADSFPRSWILSPNRHCVDSLEVILAAIFKRRLPLTLTDISQMLRLYIGLFHLDTDRPRPWVLRLYLPVSGMVRNLEWYFGAAEISADFRDLLQQFHQILTRGGNGCKEEGKLAVRVEKLLGATFDSYPDPGENWADEALSSLETKTLDERLVWEALFLHAADTHGAKPNAKWLTEAARHRQAVGAESLFQHLAAWLDLISLPPAFNQEAPHFGDVGIVDRSTLYAEYIRDYTQYADAKRKHISEKNVLLLRGLAWYASSGDSPELAHGLGHMTQTAFANVAGYGTWAARAGNAGIWALGQMPGGVGVGPLARLRTRLRDRGALKLVAAAIESAAKAAGMTVDELEDLAVPTGGLGADGTRPESFGAEGSAALTLDAASGRVRLEWFGADGKPRKAVPAGVKRAFAAEVKALKTAEEEVKQALSAQAARFDGFLLEERTWPLAVWRERYLSHPVLGNLARRLIWVIGDAPCLLRGDDLQDVSGKTLEGLGDDTLVSLWHPIGAAPEAVMRWRDVLEANGIVQPFKQAHREVYLLTDAERTTRTYSNRFAAHVLKQHQFNSLCVLRGWKNALRLMVDDSYPPATRLLPRHGLRAEFWVEGIGDDYGTDTNDVGTYLRVATDQVRFYRVGEPLNRAHASGGGYVADRGDVPTDPLPLDQVPPLVLSEVMRDVDLFVGVASVGNDPAWADGGPEGRYQDYWHSYAFGDLGETAKTRAAVLARLLPRLKITPRVRLDGRFLLVQGDLRAYKIHLGSGNILMEPNDQYLCIVPGRGDETGDLFLPFEGDRMLAIILSKAFLLTDDAKIKDPTIVSQIRRAAL